VEVEVEQRTGRRARRRRRRASAASNLMAPQDVKDHWRPVATRRDTRALSPAGMFGGKAALRLVAQKSRQHAHLGPMCSAPAYFLKQMGSIKY